MDALRQLYREQAPTPTGFYALGIRGIIPNPLVSKNTEAEIETILLHHKTDTEEYDNISTPPLDKLLEQTIDNDNNHFTNVGGISNTSSSNNILERSMTDEEVLLEGLFQESLSVHSFTALQPHFARPVPPITELFENELLWLHTTDAACVLWDCSIVKDESSTGQVRDLMMSAFIGTMNPSQQQQLINELRADPRLIHQCALTPQKLPDLVENNPLIAIESLLCLMGSPQMNEYLSAIVNMEMSLHSMEVVNRLTTATELPAEFIQLYISNCIASCENIKDKYMQV